MSWAKSANSTSFAITLPVPKVRDASNCTPSQDVVGPGHEGMAISIAPRRCFAWQGHMLGVGDLSSVLISFFPPYLPGRHALTPRIASVVSIFLGAFYIDICTEISPRWLRI